MKAKFAIIAVACVVAVGMTGCTGTGAEPAESASATEEVRFPEDVDREFEALGLNDRGNIEVEGDTAADFMDPTTGVVFAKLSAESIEPGFKCTAADAPESLNGQFVAIKFDVSTMDQFAESGFPAMDFSVHDFRAWDAKGEGVLDPVGNAEACVAPEDRVVSPVEPGSRSVGLVVLDVPKGAGSASYRIGGFQGAYGWEWAW